MARKPRVEYPGAFYHVIARGNNRQAIFRDDKDHTTYLQRLERYRQRDSVGIYAYILMNNHVHLLLETAQTPLSKTMQTLQFTYTQYFNRRYHMVGHLFQGRYKAILCDRDAYLTELVRYIHLNPARVRRPVDAGTYPWSSHRAYLGDVGPVQIAKDRVLGQFSNRVGPARKAYLAFLADGMKQGHEPGYYATVDQRILGDERFVEEVISRTQVAQDKEIERPKRRVTFSRLMRAVAQVHGLLPSELTTRRRVRGPNQARGMLAFLGREWSGLMAKELGKLLNRDASMISRLCGSYAKHRHRGLENQIRKILENKSIIHA